MCTFEMIMDVRKVPPLIDQGKIWGFIRSWKCISMGM